MTVFAGKMTLKCYNKDFETVIIKENCLLFFVKRNGEWM